MKNIFYPFPLRHLMNLNCSQGLLFPWGDGTKINGHRYFLPSVVANSKGGGSAGDTAKHFSSIAAPIQFLTQYSCFSVCLLVCNYWEIHGHPASHAAVWACAWGLQDSWRILAKERHLWYSKVITSISCNEVAKGSVLGGRRGSVGFEPHKVNCLERHPWQQPQTGLEGRVKTGDLGCVRHLAENNECQRREEWTSEAALAKSMCSHGSNWSQGIYTLKSSFI